MRAHGWQCHKDNEQTKSSLCSKTSLGKSGKVWSIGGSPMAPKDPKIPTHVYMPEHWLIIHQKATESHCRWANGLQTMFNDHLLDNTKYKMPKHVKHVCVYDSAHMYIPLRKKNMLAFIFQGWHAEVMINRELHDVGNQSWIQQKAKDTKSLRKGCHQWSKTPKVECAQMNA
jgi:hypothetical protein